MEELGKCRIQPRETWLGHGTADTAETRGREREEMGKSGCCSDGRGKKYSRQTIWDESAMTDESKDRFQPCYHFSPWKCAGLYEGLEQSLVLCIVWDSSKARRRSGGKQEPPDTKPTARLVLPPSPLSSDRRGGGVGPLFHGGHKKSDPSTDLVFLISFFWAEGCTRHPREAVDTYILHAENKTKTQIRK